MFGAFIIIALSLAMISVIQFKRQNNLIVCNYPSDAQTLPRVSSIKDRGVILVSTYSLFV